jgi:RNA polymerase sigma factor (sigma-70 family)
MSAPVRLAVPVELLKAAQAGDRAALVQVLEAAQPDVHRYARTACKTSSDAEDAAQDALFLIYRRIGRLCALGSFTGWAFAIVRRECLRLFRRRFRRNERASGEPFADRSADRDEADLRIDLASAIESLPPHYREIVVRRDIREMTINEVASDLVLTRETVKARLHRARTLLREYLQN